MNPRARRARRILRDHRRAPLCASHTRWNARPYGVEGRTLWACPRCVRRRSLDTKISVTGHREVHAMYNYFVQARNIPAAPVEWLNALGGEE